VTDPLPDGFRVSLDPSTRSLGRGWLIGGRPRRALRLSDEGARAWSELGTPRSPAARRLARRLTDINAAQPVPARVRAELDVTVVIPVRDRADDLDRCLRALGSQHLVLVVDDASIDATSIAEVCARHGASLRRREVNGGPGRARDDGLAAVATPFVAFVDSDCVPPPDWVERLGKHFDDELVGAVAARIVPSTDRPRSTLERYSETNGALDLGTSPARVTIGSHVSYVPTAALVVRTSALTDVTCSGAVFDTDLRVGEDVDLTWRLDAAGWRIRYEPAVQVRHREPDTWFALLSRRYRYGMSAGPLAMRHPDRFHPLVLTAETSVAAASLLAGRPSIGITALAASVLRTRRSLRRAGVPTIGAAQMVVRSDLSVLVATGRYLTQHAAPLLLVLATKATSLRRRLAAVSFLVAPALRDWLMRRPRLDPVRYVLARIADDIAYGSGVWAGCCRHRSLLAVKPFLHRRAAAHSTHDST
jgi:mycofactocin system glycosyltransferase